MRSFNFIKLSDDRTSKLRQLGLSSIDKGMYLSDLEQLLMLAGEYLTL